MKKKYLYSTKIVINLRNSRFQKQNVRKFPKIVIKHVLKICFPLVNDNIHYVTSNDKHPITNLGIALQKSQEYFP